MTTTEPVPKTPVLYKGCIDWVASGVIRGWVYSPDNPNEPIDFKLLLDGEELLHSSADLYRDDLEAVGFGNGVHGYCCPHHLAPDKLEGKTLQLVSLDNQPIGKSFTVAAEEPINIAVKKLSSAHYLLQAQVEASEDKVVTLQLFYENKRFWQGLRALKKGTNQLELPVCENIIDSKSHLITLGMLGKVSALWQGPLTLSINKVAVETFSRVKNTENKPVIVMIDRSTPKPDKDAGSYAATQEISLLQSLGFHVVFIPDDFTYSPNYTETMQECGVEILFSPYYLNSADALKSVLPKVSAVYITRYQYVEKHLKTIKSFSGELPIIFNNADLHFLREIRQANTLGDDAMLQKAMKTREREVNVMKNVDAILSYSEFEHAVITSHILKSDNIHKCPWVVEGPKNNDNTPFSERKGIAFLGGYEHPANIFAVEFFIEEVMPLLRAKDEQIKITIYGSHMPNDFYKYACDDVIIKGYVESLDDVYLNHRVFVAPLFFGAGVKGKVLAAAAYGMPCVLSPVAIEATGLVDNISALVAETAEQWANSVYRLYFSEKEWLFISENQQAMILEQYSFSTAKNMMADVLSAVDLKIK